MRVCSQCGKSGHNKRTCPAKPPPAPPPYRRGALDAETQAAIDWWLESRYPGYLARRSVAPEEK